MFIYSFIHTSKQALIIQRMLSQISRLRLLQCWLSVEALSKQGASFLKWEDMHLFLSCFATWLQMSHMDHHCLSFLSCSTQTRLDYSKSKYYWNISHYHQTDEHNLLLKKCISYSLDNWWQWRLCHMCASPKTPDRIALAGCFFPHVVHD